MRSLRPVLFGECAAMLVAVTSPGSVAAEVQFFSCDPDAFDYQALPRGAYVYGNCKGNNKIAAIVACKAFDLYVAPVPLTAFKKDGARYALIYTGEEKKVSISINRTNGEGTVQVVLDRAYDAHLSGKCKIIHKGQVL